MSRHDIIAIGGSTGSIQALKKLLSQLPRDLPAAIFVVVHVGASGKNLLASILDSGAELAVQTAADGEPIQQGHVYVAPADHHLLVIEDAVVLGRGPRENLTRPAIDPLFRSVAMSYGPRAIAVVLTGGLDDGAAGMADVKRCGGITVVQNPADAEMAEMPLNALRATDVDYREPLAGLAHLLQRLVAEPAGPAQEVPFDLRLEVEIARGRPSTDAQIMQIAQPTTLSCPACGGVLSQLKQGPLRFRCQVGHSYSAETLSSRKEDSVDEAMRVALRIVDERAVLAEKMAQDAIRGGLTALAERYNKRAADLRQHLATLADLLPEPTLQAQRSRAR